jgi:hypothetical protein
VITFFITLANVVYSFIQRITINIHCSFFLEWFRIALKPNLPFVVYGLFGLHVTHGPWIIVHRIIMNSIDLFMNFEIFAHTVLSTSTTLFIVLSFASKNIRKCIWSKSHFLNSTVYTWAMMRPRMWPSTLCHKMKFVFNKHMSN